MTKDELVAAVELAIGSLSGIYMGKAAESDLYEVALLTCAVDAAQQAGAQIRLLQDRQPLTGPATFRTGPGNLWSPGFTYIEAYFPGYGRTLEIHLGAKVAGGSTVPHECDVAIIDGEECDRSRSLRAHPRRTKVVAALEAKHYTASPGIGIGRGFLGFSGEIGGSKCFLVFPAASSTNLGTLIAKKDPECMPEVTPGSPAADRLVKLLDQRMRYWMS